MQELYKQLLLPLKKTFMFFFLPWFPANLFQLFGMLHKHLCPLLHQLPVSLLSSLTQEGQRGGYIHKAIRDMVHHCTA